MPFCPNCGPILSDLGFIPICTSCGIYQGMDEEEINFAEMPVSLMPSQSILSMSKSNYELYWTARGPSASIPSQRYQPELNEFILLLRMYFNVGSDKQVISASEKSAPDFLSNVQPWTP